MFYRSPAGWKIAMNKDIALSALLKKWSLAKGFFQIAVRTTTGNVIKGKSVKKSVWWKKLGTA